MQYRIFQLPNQESANHVVTVNNKAKCVTLNGVITVKFPIGISSKRFKELYGMEGIPTRTRTSELDEEPNKITELTHKVQELNELVENIKTSLKRKIEESERENTEITLKAEKKIKELQTEHQTLVQEHQKLIVKMKGYQGAFNLVLDQIQKSIAPLKNLPPSVTFFAPRLSRVILNTDETILVAQKFLE